MFAVSNCTSGLTDDDWFLYKPHVCGMNIMAHRVLLIIESVFSCLLILRQLFLLRTTQKSLIPALFLYTLSCTCILLLALITLLGDSKRFFQARYALLTIGTEFLYTAMTWRQLVFLEIVLSVKEMVLKVGMRKYYIIAAVFTLIGTLLLFLLWTIPWHTTPDNHENIVRAGNAVTCIQAIFVVVGLLYLSANTIKIMQTTVDLQNQRSTNHSRGSISGGTDRIKERIKALSHNAKISASTVSLAIILHGVMTYERMHYYLTHIIFISFMVGQVGLLRFLSSLEQTKKKISIIPGRPSRPSLGPGQETGGSVCCCFNSASQKHVGESTRRHLSHPSSSDAQGRHSQNSPIGPSHKSGQSRGAHHPSSSHGRSGDRHKGHPTSSSADAAAAVVARPHTSHMASAVEMFPSKLSEQRSSLDRGGSSVPVEMSQEDSSQPIYNRTNTLTLNQSPKQDTQVAPDENPEEVNNNDVGGNEREEDNNKGNEREEDNNKGLGATEPEENNDLQPTEREEFRETESGQMVNESINSGDPFHQEKNIESGRPRTSIIFTAPNNDPNHESNVVRIHTPTASPHGTPRSSQRNDHHIGSRGSQSPYSTIRAVHIDRSPSNRHRAGSEDGDEEQKPGLNHQNSGSLVRSQHLSRVSSLEPPRPGVGNSPHLSPRDGSISLTGQGPGSQHLYMPRVGSLEPPRPAAVDTQSPRLSPRDGSLSLTGAGPLALGGTPRTTPKSEIRHGSGIGTGLVKGHQYPPPPPSLHPSPQSRRKTSQDQ